MHDWNYNGDYDAFDTATDMMILDDMDQQGQQAGSGRGGYRAYAFGKTAKQKEQADSVMQEMKPWEYLVTIYFMVIIVFGIAVYLIPEVIWNELHDIFGNAVVVLVFLAMILTGLWLFWLVMKDEKRNKQESSE